MFLQAKTGAAKRKQGGNRGNGAKIKKKHKKQGKKRTTWEKQDKHEKTRAAVKQRWDGVDAEVARDWKLKDDDGDTGGDGKVIS